MPPKKKNRQSNKFLSSTMAKRVKYPQEEGFVITDRFYGKTTDDDKAVMTYKFHRIDMPNCTEDTDKVTNEISDAMLDEYWDRQRHAALDLQHSLPERDMMEKFTDIMKKVTDMTENKVDIVDCHTQGSKVDDSNLFIVTIRLAVAPSEIVKLLRVLIKDSPKAAATVKMCDGRLGSTFEKDVALGNVGGVAQPDEGAVEAKKSRKALGEMNVDEVSVSRTTPEVDDEIGDSMYGRIEPPVNAAERHLYRLAAVTLECSRASVSRIHRAKFVTVYDKSDKGIMKDSERIARKKGACELTITCHSSAYTEQNAKLMKECQDEIFNACMKEGMVAVQIENTTGDLVPPMNAVHPVTGRRRRYIESVENIGDIHLVDDLKRVHCTCQGACGDGCPCKKTQEENTFECNSKCKCSVLNCGNREMTQIGRRVSLKLRRSTKKTWEVVTLEDIFANELVSVYIAQRKPTSDGIVEEDRIRKGGLTPTQIFVVRGGKYAYDAHDACNIMPYVQHSCQPNCRVWDVWTEIRDTSCPFLGIYAVKDIKKGSVLTYDYSEDYPLGGERSEHGDLSYPLEECKCGAKLCRMDYPEEVAAFEEFEK